MGVPAPLSDSDRTPRCSHCGEVIGVYEPAIHVTGELVARTSRARDPELSSDSPGRLYHVACYELSHVRSYP